MRRAHAQHDAGALRSAQQVEGLEAIVDVRGRVDQLRDRGGTGLRHPPVERLQAAESAAEIVGREDQSGRGMRRQDGLGSVAELGPDEIGVLQIDEIHAGLDGGPQNTSTQALGVRPGAAFPRVAAGYEHRNPPGPCVSNCRDQGHDGIGLEVVEIVRAEFEHFRSGGDGLARLPLREIQVLRRDGNCQIGRHTPEV